jgi:hypothetical protein
MNLRIEFVEFVQSVALLDVRFAVLQAKSAVLVKNSPIFTAKVWILVANLKWLRSELAFLTLTG